MSIDLIVDNSISDTLQNVKDQSGNTSALEIAGGQVAISADASGASAQGSVFNPNNSDGNVAGFRFHTASGWNVMLRTRQGQAWLELTDGAGSPRHVWVDGNYTANGLVTAGQLSVSGSQVVFSGLSGLPASGTADLTVDSSGNVAPQTSSARFKENIEPLQDDFRKVLDAAPVSFVNKATGDREIGYIAEEFHDNDLDNLVSYDAEGKPLSVQYKMLPIYALEIVKEQQRVIEELRSELGKIKAKLQ